MLLAYSTRTFLIATKLFMAKMITPNFSVHEMTSNVVVAGMKWMGNSCGCYKPCVMIQGPLKVSSGFRCEDHNQMVSKTGRNGPHTLAKATDILISGERAMVLFEKARQIGFSGIGLSQKGNHASRFVHLDTLPRKAFFLLIRSFTYLYN